ncbi:hypothetical protein F5890DRAFT_1507787 [Lentinula detonsa]|uniref:Uncharacterized protein n=1 Tax=Lentinula detonsa TaxID=2804962 RepID=A0AA38UTB8_9AGAR|nr:hypothetical protein F5890DRAFT_1507787 [Lentinula detonsa]
MALWICLFKRVKKTGRGMLICSFLVARGGMPPSLGLASLEAAGSSRAIWRSAPSRLINCHVPLEYENSPVNALLRPGNTPLQTSRNAHAHVILRFEISCAFSLCNEHTYFGAER